MERTTDVPRQSRGRNPYTLRHNPRFRIASAPAVRQSPGDPCRADPIDKSVAGVGVQHEQCLKRRPQVVYPGNPGHRRSPYPLDCVCLSHAARRSRTLTLWHEIGSRRGRVWSKETPDELRKDVREDSCDTGCGCPAADSSAPDLRQSAFDFCKVVHPPLPPFGSRFRPRRRFARRPQAVCGRHAAGFRGLHALARMGFVRTLMGAIREKPASFPPALTIE